MLKPFFRQSDFCSIFIENIIKLTRQHNKNFLLFANNLAYSGSAKNKICFIGSAILKYSEQFFWAIALVTLFFMDTSVKAPSFCFFKLIGLKFCPGCGIGHSIHDVLHFNFQQSFHEHILGLPAAIIIVYKIIKPLHAIIKTTKNGSTTTIYDVAGSSAR